MSLHIFPAALHPTPAQLAEARRILSVEHRTAEDVARRPVARVAAWNVLRNAKALANDQTPPHHPGPFGGPNVPGAAA